METTIDHLIITPKRNEVIKKINNTVLTNYRGILFISGPNKCGKYTTVKHVLKQNNCVFYEVECTGHSRVTLLQVLPTSMVSTKTEEIDTNEDENLSTCFNSSVLGNKKVSRKISEQTTILDIVKELYEKTNVTNTLYIVLRHVEKLIKVDKDFFYSLFKIRDYSEYPICIYLLSNTVKERIISPLREYSQIRSIFFNSYTKLDLISIVSSCLPTFNQTLDIEFQKQLYMKLVSLVVGLFYATTQDVHDILRVCFNSFGEYIKPVINNNNLDNINLDSVLYENISSVLLNYLKNISEQLKDRENEYSNNNSGGNNNKNSLKDDIEFIRHKRNIEGFSYHTKIILISCFLASTFSASKDRLLYTKETVKRQLLSQEKVTGTLKLFHFQRAKKICKSLFGVDESEICDSVFATLSSLKYLETINTVESTIPNLFRCTNKVHINFIKQISKSISFNIESYIDVGLFSK